MTAISPEKSFQRAQAVFKWNSMKVFISSTFADLQPYRRVAIEVVQRQLGQPLAMEFFPARPDDATTVCEEDVRACDIMVGIYGHRYGFIPEGLQKSITQQEAEPIYREIGDRLGEANCLSFQALLDVKEGSSELALTKLSRVLVIAEAMGDCFAQGFIFLECSDTRLLPKQTLEAKEGLNQVMKLFEVNNRPDRAQQCREKLLQIT
jgi:hypothetical protein